MNAIFEMKINPNGEYVPISGGSKAADVVTFHDNVGNSCNLNIVGLSLTKPL